MISIITVVKNDSEGLLKTINSVEMLPKSNFEYILIDGNSSDNTLDLIEEKRALIDKYVSEKDRGIYDAMNKGLNLATGSHCLFLNAGDTISKDVFLEVFHFASSMPSFLYICQTQIIYEKDFFLYRENRSNKFLPHHQSVFYPHNFYSVNRFDDNYSIMGDIAFTKLAVSLHTSKKINKVIVYSNLAGYSFKINGKFKVYSVLFKDYLKINGDSGLLRTLLNLPLFFLGITIKYLVYNLLGPKYLFQIIKSKNNSI